ncbi:MAG: OadG family transporter subunit [Saccharofermentanales bacterium]|jgi:Na+-transporting methylmalonyl-CoA/oxaloacetate decarboxylase gamma subunit
MDFQNMSFMDGVVISLFSILIVFAVLLLISYLIDIVRLILYRNKDKKDDSAPNDPSMESIAEEPLPVPADKPDSRTAAIIAAAIAVFLGKDTRFVIKNVKRYKTPLSEWETAGIKDAQRRPL